MNLNTAVLRLKRILQTQDINLDSMSDTMEESIETAVDRYSVDVKSEIISDMIGNATGILPLPSTFTTGFSVLRSVEYPYGETEPTYLDEDDYGVHKKKDGTSELRLYEEEPEATETIRIVFTSYIDQISDVPAYHTLAVLQLSAYYACLSEAVKASNTSSGGEGLDFVDHITASNRLESLAEKFLRNYMDRLFGSKEENEAKKEIADPASDQDTWTTETRWADTRIFHTDDD